MVSQELCELCGGQEPRPSPSLPGTDRHRRDEEEQQWSSRADKSLDRPLGEEGQQDDRDGGGMAGERSAGHIPRMPFVGSQTVADHFLMALPLFRGVRDPIQDVTHWVSTI